MSFTSVRFLIFVAIVVVAYYLVPKKARWVVLLAASFAFYLVSSAETFVFLLLTIAVTFFGGRAIGKRNDELKEYLAAHPELDRKEKKAARTANKKKKRGTVALILVVDFGILALLKYFSGAVDLIAQAIGFNFDAGVLIPLGISFYTFQSAAYIIDLYRDKYAADTNIAKFALFTSFFPQLIQGPIPRYDHLAHQLYEGHELRYKNLAHGAELMLWGFFKKLVIADVLATPVSAVFSDYTSYQGWAVFLALFFYMIQIYADFSGGIDIARGVARLVGIDLANNFRRPYFADSLSEFWRRWHMSLSFWTRDYIFFPITLSKTFGKAGRSLRRVLGDRVGKLFPIMVAQLATFTVIGIWHGADFKYVAYGWYNALVIISGLLLEPYFDKLTGKLHINKEGLLWKHFGVLRTFFIVTIGRVFPRAASFPVAISMLGSLFALRNYDGVTATIHSLGLTAEQYLVLLVACAIWFAVSVLEERIERKQKAAHAEKKSIVAGEAQGSGDEETSAEVRDLLDRAPALLRWICYLVLIVFILGFGSYGPGYDASQFIYRGF